MDANDHIVTRPGQPRPTITVSPNAILNPLGPVMRADGEFYAETAKVNPRASGNVIVSASGGVPTVTTIVPIR